MMAASTGESAPQLTQMHARVCDQPATLQLSQRQLGCLARGGLEAEAAQRSLVAVAQLVVLQLKSIDVLHSSPAAVLLLSRSSARKEAAEVAKFRGCNCVGVGRAVGSLQRVAQLAG